jgi:1,4-dihydroxy-2-naphthoate polyprenyltransferase
MTSPSSTLADTRLPTGFARWVAGARPRTLPAAIVPVAVGTACASLQGSLGSTWWRAICALVVSLALQVGVNYANDYSDGVKGTDADRVGPMRLVGSGAASPGAVKRAAYLSFLVAAVAGLTLALSTTLWLIAVGVAAIAAAWFYTGGPKPYGYAGLGEAFVFVFFGVVATAGSDFVHTESIRAFPLVASVAVGLFATALLVVNNLRDIPGDTVAGKRTLAVRMGDRKTRLVYLACLVEPFIITIVLAVGWNTWATLLGLVALPTLISPIRSIRGGAAGRDLIPVLGATGKSQLFFGMMLAIGIAIS